MKYHVEKSITIDADIAKVRPFVEDFNKWNSWSPWTLTEPDCPITVEGMPGKVGHSMKWEGSVIGSGTNTIERVDDKGIHYDLRFLSPQKDQAKTSLLLEPEGSGTKVTWTLDGAVPFFVFFMAEMIKNWIGMDYERGLRILKEVVEKGKVNATTTNNGVVDIESISYVGIKRTAPIPEMPELMKKDCDKIVEDIVKGRGKMARHWVTLYPKFNMRTMTATYITAVSDENLEDEDLGPEYVRGEIKGGKALEIKHDGSYDFLANAWSMGMMYTRAKKMKVRPWPFEQYWNNPAEVAPEELKTSVFFPLK